LIHACVSISPLHEVKACAPEEWLNLNERETGPREVGKEAKAESLPQLRGLRLLRGTVQSDSLPAIWDHLVDGPEGAAARAMLYPVGFTEADFKKPIIGIASTWSNVTPRNMHIDKLALES